MSDRSLADWLRRLEALHPSEIELGLARVRAVAERLELLEPLARTVIVAGTNGKGSVVSLLQAALVSQGVSCGAYLSPHLNAYNERIRVNGDVVADDDIIDAFQAIDDARGDISLTYFEFGTLAALWIFRARAVHWQILEVGLGGRLDAVNIIDADFAAVTSIGLDHQEWLGPDREHIAVEKAGVARTNRPCVVLERALPATLLPTLDQVGAQVLLLGRDFEHEDGMLTTVEGECVTLPRPPGLLADNVAGAVQLAALLGLDVGDAQLLHALEAVQLPGRRQRREWHGVELVLDVAHNRESVAALADFLDQQPCQGDTFAVYASLSDKPIHDILAAVGGRVDHWHFPDFAEVPRRADPTSYSAPAPTATTQHHADFASAWQQVRDEAKPGDRVLIFGSFITVGAALQQLEHRVEEQGN